MRLCGGLDEDFHVKRRVAIAIPARNEANWIGACLDRLLAMPEDPRVASLRIIVVANNCTDATVEAVRRAPAEIELIETILPPEKANAGHARRAALDAGAEWLRRPHDVLLSTDADTHVAADWLSRTLDHLDAGYDAVAGLARLKGAELRLLPRQHRLRLAQLQRYETALAYLRSQGSGDEPWPRHDYEGGASIALTVDRYWRMGGAPTPEVGEDKALFDAVRAVGGKVRHATDVKVYTSCRLKGRAIGGASDTLDHWGRQDDQEPIYQVNPLNLALGHAPQGQAGLSFAELPREIAKARALVKAVRAGAGLAEAC